MRHADHEWTAGSQGGRGEKVGTGDNATVNYEVGAYLNSERAGLGLPTDVDLIVDTRRGLRCKPDWSCQY